MRFLFSFALVLILQSFAQAQTPVSYNEFKVVTKAWQIANEINNTPSADPVYLVLAPGTYEIAQPIVIDRDGPVYIHGLSTTGTLLTDSIGFQGDNLFVVHRSAKFSLATLRFGPTRRATSSNPDLDSWRRGGILVETNSANQPHNVDIQEVWHGGSVRINAAGTYRVQSCRVPNLGYVVNHPDADFVLTGGHCWGAQFGGFPKFLNTDPTNPFNGYNPNLSAADQEFMRDSTCAVWQKEGRVRIYDANIVQVMNAYEFRFESKSHLGPHVVAGTRSETENFGPDYATCQADARIFKAVCKVAGEGNEIIFKCNTPITVFRFYQGACSENIAFVDFQAKNGKAFILGNTIMDGYQKMIMNTAGTNLDRAEIVLLGNKIGTMATLQPNQTVYPQENYADIQLAPGKSIYNMGNMTRLENGQSIPLDWDSNVDINFSDWFLTDQDEMKCAPVIPQDLVPDALLIPNFELDATHPLLALNILINVSNPLYGANPTDTQDDYAAIQAAADVAMRSNGLLYFPPGDYYVSNTIEMNRLAAAVYPNNANFPANSYNSSINNARNGGSLLIAGANENTTKIHGIGSVFSIFSITNAKMARMQGLTLIVNNGNLAPITGVTNAQTGTYSKAIVAVDNFDASSLIPGQTLCSQKYLEYQSVYLWNFRNCNFIGGQVGVATQFRKQLTGTAYVSGLGTTVTGVFSGRYIPDNGACFPQPVAWGGLGESFALSYCRFENNNVGFSTAHHQSFCHLISNCTFVQDTVGVSQYHASGTNPLRGLDALVNDMVGGNFTILNTVFSDIERDFNTVAQTQTAPNYFNNCVFNARTAIFIGGAFGQVDPNYPSTWYTNNGSNKNFMCFVENSSFGYDHTNDAIVCPPIPYPATNQDIINYYRRFTFVADRRASLFCLNSDLTTTTFIKNGLAGSPTFNPDGTVKYGANVTPGYGMIAQCLMPGGSASTFKYYGTNVYTGLPHYFNFNPFATNIQQYAPYPFPAGIGANPPVSLYTPRYVPKEVVQLNATPSAQNDRYFWRIMQVAVGSTFQYHRDYALPFQRILLYNAGNLTSQTSAPPAVTAADVTICSGETATLNASGATDYTWSTGQTGGSISVTPTATTTYVVTGSAGACVADPVSVQVTVLSALDNSVTVSGNTLTANQSNAIYQWVDCNANNSPVLGATAQTFIPVASGSYAVSITLGNCSTLSDCNAVIVSATQEPEADFKVQIFPNPVSTELNLNIDSKKSTQIWVKLTDVHGTVLEQWTNAVHAGTNRLTHPVKELPAGIYLLEIQAENGTRSFKLVKT